jgi:hypothetical protein
MAMDEHRRHTELFSQLTGCHPMIVIGLRRWLRFAGNLGLVLPDIAPAKELAPVDAGDWLRKEDRLARAVAERA